MDASPELYIHKAFLVLVEAATAICPSGAMPVHEFYN